MVCVKRIGVKKMKCKMVRKRRIGQARFILRLSLFPSLFLFFFFVPLLFSLSASQVLSLGVSPAKLSFDDILPGGYAGATILLSNPKSVPVRIFVAPDDWLVVNTTSTTLPPGGSTHIHIVLQPPADAAPGDYKKKAVFTSTPLIYGGGGAFSRLALTLSLPVSFSVSTAERPSCVLGGFVLPDVEVGSAVRGAYSVKNDGNVRVVPSGNLSIIDDAGGEQAAVVPLLGGELLPTQTGRFHFVAPPLPEGSYEARLTLQCGNVKRRFSVVPRGTLKTSGELSALHVTNENESLLASFSNTGETNVEARFRGVVLQERKVVRVVESDPLLFTPGESQSFTEHLNLPPGQYEVRGSIIYEGRQTPERTVKFFIAEGAGRSSRGRAGGWQFTRFPPTILLSVLILFPILFLILFLIVLIVRKKRRTL